MITNRPLDMDHVRAQFPALNNGWVFFDNAGGSQILKGAVDRINAFLYDTNVQIGGSYAVSRDAAHALSEAREAARLFVNAERPEEIVFGHSTTVLMQNLAAAMRRQLAPGDEIVITIADHESNIGPWDRLAEFGIKIKVWPLNTDTMRLELEDLARILSARTRLVCVHHVSNILGEINPIREIADLVHAHGARLCVDAVAYAPHRLIDVQAFDADYYVFSLYKAYGPHAAIMYGKYELLLELDTLYHYFYGKDKVPGKLEAGNPNYELACSIHGIVDYLDDLGGRCGASDDASARTRLEVAFDAITAQEDMLVARFLDWANTRDAIHIVGQSRNTPDSARVPTLAFTVDGWSPEALARAVDPSGIAVRHGDFHSRRLIEYLDLARSGGVVRVSMVHYNTLEEVDRLIAVIDQILADGHADIRAEAGAAR